MPTTVPASLHRALQRFELLAGVLPADIAKLAEEGTLRSYAPGEVVLRQGDFGHSMFFLIKGSLLLKLKRFDRAEMVISVLKQNSTFGELGLAGDRPRTATVVANEESTVLEIDRLPFGRIFGRNDEVIARVDRAYRRSCIHANLYSDPLFADLPQDAMEELTRGAEVHSFEKDDVIIREGEEADAFFIVWSGHVRISRASAQGEPRVFAYVAEGNYFGEQALLSGGRRSASVIANDHVEIVRIGRAELERVLQSHPGVADALRARARERDEQASRVLADPTRQVFIADMLKLGAAHAANALVIDLGACTRCGACSEACHELYGNSRLTRRGKTFVLPRTGQRMLMPNSCWHCKDPECMIGCPTDALRRGPSGEIHVLEDRCIGCEICANRCPWGNITMADRSSAAKGGMFKRLVRRLLGTSRVPELRTAAPGEPSQAKAVKCDLCEGQPEAACVAACPYHAIARVDPNAFLRDAMES